MFFWMSTNAHCRSQWPRGLSRRSTAARPLRSWVWIPPGAWMFVCCECCVLSGRGLFDELITRTEESYRLWCVVVCDLETSRMRRPWPALGRSATKKKRNLMSTILVRRVLKSFALVSVTSFCSALLCSAIVRWNFFSLDWNFHECITPSLYALMPLANLHHFLIFTFLV